MDPVNILTRRLEGVLGVSYVRRTSLLLILALVIPRKCSSFTWLRERHALHFRTFSAYLSGGTR